MYLKRSRARAQYLCSVRRRSYHIKVRFSPGQALFFEERFATIEPQAKAWGSVLRMALTASGVSCDSRPKIWCADESAGRCFSNQEPSQDDTCEQCPPCTALGVRIRSF